MKLTKTQLKQLIQEELETIIEANPLAGPTRTGPFDGAPAASPSVGPGQGEATRWGTRTGQPGKENKKLQLVAKELQLLLNKIKSEL